MQNMQNLKRVAALTALAGCAAIAAPTHAGELSANASVTNNYIWRGLTQTENNSAVQGGIDYATDSGFYVGTWVSNVNYGPSDVYSYEHDLYAGYAFETGSISWDVGYLYYNYDEEANFDFGEVYATVGIGGFSASAYVLTNTEADEGVGQDFGAGSTYYVSADYGFEVGDGIGIGLHVGYHDGDFAEAFNGSDGGYYDYNISLSKGGFGFMFTDTNVSGPAADGGYDNDEYKVVVSYSVDIEL
ncbi:TorF family putative porin [Congregibacter brevis]|uniref:TorF family putative porin n=1 Tax=Congregibacter brevis TaxID=3081201 RepID=A0ABZ0IFJ0_9GAMM|nr:TorF family putative porin [Congregibacter sp. IMCC45268]